MEPGDIDEKYLTALHMNILTRHQFAQLSDAQKKFFMSPIIYNLVILQSKSGEYLFPVNTMIAWTNDQRAQFKREATRRPEEHRAVVDKLTAATPENAILFEKDILHWINFEKARNFFDNNDPYL